MTSARVEERILELLRSQGPQTISSIGRRLGLSYGAAQWRIFLGERQRLWKTAKIAGKHVVYLPGQDPKAAVTAFDVVICLKKMVGKNDPVEKVYEYLKRCLPPSD